MEHTTHITQIEKLRKLRASVRVLILKGKLKVAVKDVDDFNEETLLLLLAEEEKEKMDSLNGSLSQAVIEASIEICRRGGILKGETLDSLKRDLLENDVVTANAKVVVSYATSYIPLLGIVVATGFVGFYILRSAMCDGVPVDIKFTGDEPQTQQKPEDTKLPETFQGI